MARTRKKKTRPKPPPHLEDEALLEWERICDDLEKAGRLLTIDRAILTVYVRQWALHHAAERAVSVHGFSTTYSNGNEGATVAYSVLRDTAKVLRTLLNDMGLTPALRGAASPEDEGLPNF